MSGGAVEGISVDDLLKAKGALENDMEILISSERQLKEAQERFLVNITALLGLEEAEEGVEMMVPITGTVYTAGRLASKCRFTIDIGTGYFVEMDSPRAVDYYKRKVEFLARELEKLGKVGEEKKMQLIYVYKALQQVQDGAS